MTDTAEFHAALATEIGSLPQGTILSKALTTTDKIKVTLFGFDTGQELTEHTAAYPAILHFLAGEADLKLGKDHYAAQTGSWAYMPAKLPHSLIARTPVTMLLIMIIA